MKKSLLIAGLALASATHVDAQIAKSPVWNTNHEAPRAQQLVLQPAVGAIEASRYLSLTPGKGEQKNALTLNPIWRNEGQNNFTDHNSNQTIQWDPTSGTIFMFNNMQDYNDDGNWTGGIQRIIALAPGSNRLDTVYSRTQTGIWTARTNFLMFNRTATQQPRQVQWYMAGNDYVVPAGTLQAYSAHINDGTTPFDLVVDGPVAGNPNSGYTFGSLGSLLPSTSNGDRVTSIGVLNSSNTVQYGSYGTYTYDFDATDVVFESNQSPTAWQSSFFFQPAGNLRSSFVSQMVGDVDSEGNIYAAVNSPLASDGSATDRRVSVSVSADGGVTWSAWNTAPRTAYTAYASAQGWQEFGVFRPYDEDDFVVISPNHYSYFCRMGVVVNNQFSGDVHLVEVEYRNNQWTVRKVADIQDVPLVFTRLNPGPDDATWPLEYEVNPRGNCIDAARTADGSTIALSWLDGNPNRGFKKFTRTPATFRQADNTLAATPTDFDSLLVSDVYFAHRAVDGGSWSVTNLTDDDQMEVGAKLPKVIPNNINQTPILVSTALSITNVNPQFRFYNAIRALPAPLYQSHLNYFTVINLATSITVSATDEEVMAPMAIASVSPNPTVSGAEVSWSLERSGMVFVRVVDMLGNTVQTITNGFVEAGTHAFNVNTSTMASGTYNVVISMEGRTVTAPIVVVR